ncbi:MAG: hypothetical protein M3Y35_03835 [Actinomycetota bacterium]|nr:hypothetical protein [Actinomycetota bacterium]
MTDYIIRIEFNDGADGQVVPLPGLDLDQAEEFAGELRHEVEQVQEINSPIAQVRAPGGSDFTLQPDRIVSIDLQEAQ